MKKILIYVIIFSMIAINVKAMSHEKVTYDISQVSKNSIRVILKNDISEKIQVTSYSRLNDNTIRITYIRNSDTSNNAITINLSDLRLNLTDRRYPNIVLKEEAFPDSEVFLDLPGDEEYRYAILNMFYKNIINGYDGNLFKPNDLITREEFCSIFYKLMPIPKEDIELNVFDDIESDRWSKPYINALTFKGIIKGKEEGKFKPKDNITLAEVCAIIDRAYSKINISKFGNYMHINKNHWANENVSNMLDDHIIYSADTFYKNYDLDKKLTREECALILNRLLSSYKDIK